MKFISIDIETLGLGLNAPVIEVGACIAETTGPSGCYIHGSTFHAYVTHHTYDDCEPYAMSMHPEKLKRIAVQEAPYTYLRGKDTWTHFLKWVYSHQLDWPRGKFLVGGKNVAGFDMPRLVKHCGFNPTAFHYRVLDPGCMYLQPHDDIPPALDECCKRAGLPDTVPHSALEDAIITAKVIMRHFEQLPL